MSPGWWHPPPEATTSASPGIHRSTAAAIAAGRELHRGGHAVGAGHAPVERRGVRRRRSAPGRCSWAAAPGKIRRPAAPASAASSARPDAASAPSRSKPSGEPTIRATASMIATPGTGIEREHAVLLRAARHVGEIGHAAEIEQDARRVGGREEQHVGHRNQRSALPSRGHVSGAKSADDPHAESLRQNRWLAELPRDQSAARARSVWPGNAIRATSDAGTRDSGQQPLDRFRRPLGDFAREAARTTPRRSPSAPFGCRTARIRRRSSSSYGRVTKCTRLAWVGPSSRTSAASMPSSDVPDMRPTARVGRSVIRFVPVEGRRRSSRRWPCMLA